MKFTCTSFRLALVLSAMAFAGGCATTSPEKQSEVPHGAGHGDLGEVSFKTSCNDSAQETFNRGLGLLHHMMYHQARPEFEKAAGQDANCAMARWGIAMTLFHPLWPDQPTAEELRKGMAAVEAARTIKPQTDREQDYVSAVAEYYADAPQRSEKERLEAFEKGMEKVYRKYPEDPDAAAFHALAHLATAPKGDESLAHNRRAGSILERLHKAVPRHPGGFHYLIHAYDVPELAQKALEVARNYSQVAPDVPHALHMPSHIFVRLGEWDDTISWNRRSADAALKHPADDKVSMHYVHAMDYLVYGYLQKGQDQRAEAAIQELRDRSNFENHFGSAYALAAIPARYVLERQDWDSARDLSPEPQAFAWDQHPAALAITHFARGLGSARSGDLGQARSEAETLQNLERLIREKGDSYWADLVKSQHETTMAWIRFAEKKPSEATRLMRSAADREDSLGKNLITPGHVLPTRELLGDLLASLERYDEAIQAYERSLAESPKRFASLAGAFRAAKQSGRTEKARVFASRLIEAVPGSSQRAAVVEARQWMEARRTAERQGESGAS